MNIFEFGRATWIDAESPTREDIRELSYANDLHPAIAEELLSPSPLPSYKRIGGTIFLSLFFPALKHSHTEEEIQEIDFVLKDSLLLTVRYDSIDAIHKLKKEFEVEMVIDSGLDPIDSFPLFDDVVRKMYKSLRHEIEYILSDIRRLEREIFSVKDQNRVEEIAARSRLLLAIIRTLSLNHSVLEELKSDLSTSREDIRAFLDSIEKTHEKTLRFARDTMDALRELREANFLLVTVKQNEVLKKLAIISFVTFPLSLMAGIFGMNTDAAPIVGHPHDFWIILLAMFILTGIFLLYFEHKKWI